MMAYSLGARWGCDMDGFLVLRWSVVRWFSFNFVSEFALVQASCLVRHGRYIDRCAKGVAPLLVASNSRERLNGSVFVHVVSTKQTLAYTLPSILDGAQHCPPPVWTDGKELKVCPGLEAFDMHALGPCSLIRRR